MCSEFVYVILNKTLFILISLWDYFLIFSFDDRHQNKKKIREGIIGIEERQRKNESF